LNKGASIFLVDFFDALSSASLPKLIAFVDSCHQCTCAENNGAQQKALLSMLLGLSKEMTHPLNKGASILLLVFFDTSNALPLLIHDDSHTQEACQNKTNTQYSLV
jgi:hypothetical protein